MIAGLIEKVKTNKYLMGTIYVGAGSVLAAFFSYLLQFIFGRILSVADFGTFNALISLAYLMGVPAGVFGISLIKHVSGLSSRGETKKLTTLYWRLNALSVAVGALIFTLILLFRQKISQELKIYDTSVITAFAVPISITFVGTIQSSYLQGLLRYKAFSFYSVASSFYRCFFAVAAVFLGFKLSGAFGGMFVAVVVSFLTAYFVLRKNLTVFENLSLFEDYKKLITFSLPVMFVQFGLMLLNNIDVILVKKYFDPDTAGYYSGTVTLGKIFLFGAGIVSTVMFPTISSLATKGLNYSRPFFKFLSLQLLLVGAGIIIFSSFPAFLTNVFFGQRFSSSIEFLPMFSLFIASYILINFLVLFFLAVDRASVYILMVPGLVVQYLMITLFHENLYDIIKADIYAGIITLVLLAVFFITKRNDTRNSNTATAKI